MHAVVLREARRRLFSRQVLHNEGLMRQDPIDREQLVWERTEWFLARCLEHRAAIWALISKPAP